MIKDQTIDEALIEIMRTKKALEALRAERKQAKATELAEMYKAPPSNGDCSPAAVKAAFEAPYTWPLIRPSAAHAAAKRASLDLTRKLVQLRAGK